jgi:type II secretory pathway pseudopilin PulG
VLVCALVCLAIASTLVTSTVRTALGARRSMRTQHQLQQTELLLNAGIQRATQQLHDNSDYTGETWDLSPQVIPNIESAQVTIDVSSAAEDSSREIRVSAQISLAVNKTIRRSTRFSVDL